MLLSSKKTKTYVVLFNGPPRSGKDTAARHVHKCFSYCPTIFDRFSMPMKQYFAKALGVHMDMFGNCVLEDVKDLKGGTFYEVFGATYREGQIALSEQHMKGEYGAAIFGKLLASRLTFRRQAFPGDVPLLAVIPDSGFVPEAEHIADVVGRDRVLLVRTFRDGFDYQGDSRGYIELDGVESYDLHGDTPEDVEQQAMHLVRTWYLGREGKL